jgi:hypothetical protein
MAEHQIVDCPGCGKRYSVPPGVPPGQFQCQDCSAVVVYGRGGEPAGGKPHGAKSARAHARAAAAKRRLQRDRARREEEEDDGDDRPRHAGFHPAGEKKKDAMPYVLGFATVAVLGGFGVFLFAKSREKPAPPPVPAETAGAAGAKGAGGGDRALGAKPEEKPAPEPEAAPPPPPEPAPAAPEGGLKVAPRKPSGIGTTDVAGQEAKDPPTGGLYGSSHASILLMLKEDRTKVIVPLDHLPDTPGDLRSEIDRLVATIANPDAGSEALTAQDRLVAIGRPAIPKVLSITAGLDFKRFANVADARPACVVAASMGHVMQGITGYEKIRTLQYNLTANLDHFDEVIGEWYLWWYTVGYRRATFYKKTVDEEEEKL